MRLHPGVVGLSAVLLLGGCGEEDGGDVEAATVTVTPAAVTVTPPAVTVSAPAETVTKTETVTVQPTETTSDPPSPTDDDDENGSESTGDESPTIDLPPEGDELGLDDFFNPSRDWQEGRWNVADRTDAKGVSVGLYSSVQDLELRLQNQFSSLRFDAGQSNDSVSSECTTKVDVVVDGELRETREFGFNTIQEFDGVDVRNSNAVRIEVSRSGCYDSVRVVLMGIELE